MGVKVGVGAGVSVGGCVSVGASVRAGVAVQANAIRTTMDSSTCTISANDMDDRYRMLMKRNQTGRNISSHLNGSEIIPCWTLKFIKA